MWGRRYPSIFDIFESFARGFPFEHKERDEDEWFRMPFEDMVKRFEEDLPKEYRELMREEETEAGKVRRYGPFVYGFSYTAEPGKEPVFREFGNIKPSYRGIEPSSGREPMVDIMEEKDGFKIFAELPGVDKSKVKLDVAEDSVQIKTDDERKFYKMIQLEKSVDPDSAKATYNNGVLTLTLDKMEKRKGKEVKID
ncbi:MAG: Small heat shock protein HSP16.5 [Methanosaeta sp. PtaB.Bin039]|nr:MAG: Small heat shock protein HSP16.5 [Methanosaeta sp. PtaB.Bin039]OPY44175.1 MAG: Small heat shock protein HSP16.5 [Methanosaeta sp. PtaU1.Bin028]HOT06151.1 Hsp20/alpha crystallin family protein [Methanotrichaceae archaeon]HQF15539.1 Hsp20/alpha crystallin family protein [Methanotrichaceae archaeon]HQI90274.1 Hsp20/alpha crystallin family protein [Methanotrichaceae archaeon]